MRIYFRNGLQANVVEATRVHEEFVGRDEFIVVHTVEGYIYKFLRQEGLRDFDYIEFFNQLSRCGYVQILWHEFHSVERANKNI